MTIQLTRRAVAIVVVAFLALTAVATSALVLTLSGRAEANHRFNDIAADNFFHDSTAWLKDNGIADGFRDGTFRQDGPITRGQASYWFANYNAGLELVVAESDPDQAASFSQRATCPAGKRAVAGGGQDVHFGFPNEDLVIASTGPSNGGRSWSVGWTDRDGGLEDPAGLIVYALCVPDAL